MNLYLNETSPFSRVVLATALLTNTNKLNMVWVDPWQSPNELRRVNPFCTVPVLELAESTALSESICICEFLIATAASANTASKADTNVSIGLVGVNYHNAEDVAVMGLAKTMMETAFRTVALGRFVDAENPLSERGKVGLAHSLNKLNTDLSSTQKVGYFKTTLANLYLAIAIEYVQFRHSDIFNETARPDIKAFLEQSPFKAILNRVNLATLSIKPDFKSL
ncbi:glutathione S-transferase N-terminal domain-containing protein [Shewanella sp. SR44-3]|uniref:glutathione S-transferase N-terminal domain-containing protein n=1 Tax=unclassified Shewanella TaxID=196818 RepID=UPI0015F7C22E|nr:glutathione S-transferase N-terminal domain-containing protein [Shewanella sp. SR44-3]MBB1268572.1 glutathione S-transferase N-terminal domain-containing protein [Shewanella sp. SR44-3]